MNLGLDDQACTDHFSLAYGEIVGDDVECFVARKTGSSIGHHSEGHEINGGFTHDLLSNKPATASAAR